MFDMTKTKAVLWDLDDTLYSRVDAANCVFYGMFRQLLYAGKSEEFICDAVAYMMTKVNRNTMVHPDAFAALQEKYPFDKPFSIEACQDYYYGHICEFMELFPEQLSVVKKLRKLGIKQGIITNAKELRLDSQRRKIVTLGLEPLFDVIVISGELGIHKPDRRIFDHTAELLGVKNEECLFVGDDPHSDIAGALGADMETVWLDNWSTYDGSFADDPRVHRVKSVLEYFKL
jgi:putative hydrolase of the HAD superfamily